MSIVFFCHSCGSRFDVDPRMAGKQGRCKKCGERMTVPAGAKVAATAASHERAAVGAGVGTGAGAGVSAGRTPASSWVGEVDANKVSLAPLTIDRMPSLKKRTMFAEDDLADSKPYLLAQPEKRSGGRVVSQVSGVKMLWRRQLGHIERVFRWINQTAYLVSVPFLMMLLLGVMIRSHSMANFGAVVVVLLNIARLVTGVFNVAVIPFRDGTNLRRLKKPIRRVIEPALTIGLVGLAFALVPWLSYTEPRAGTIAGRIRAGYEKVERKLDNVSEKAKALGTTPDGKKPES